MSAQRKQCRAECKARVALEALKGCKTVHEFASTYGVHPTQIAHWKHRLHKEMAEIFSGRRDTRERDREALQAQRYQQIGQRKVALDRVKKMDSPRDAKRGLIEPAHPQISIARQRALLGLPRSTYYIPTTRESPEHLHVMRVLDEQFTGHAVLWCTPYDRLVVARLLCTMGLETMYPQPRTSRSHPEHDVWRRRGSASVWTVGQQL